MVKVSFTQNLQRHVVSNSCEVRGATVREVLDAVFAQAPVLRSYVVDDQGGLRQHMRVFVDGEAMVDREKLSDPVDDGAEVFVMQALSGG